MKHPRLIRHVLWFFGPPLTTSGSLRLFSALLYIKSVGAVRRQAISYGPRLPSSDVCLLIVILTRTSWSCSAVTSWHHGSSDGGTLKSQLARPPVDVAVLQLEGCIENPLVGSTFIQLFKTLYSKFWLSSHKSDFSLRIRAFFWEFWIFFLRISTFFSKNYDFFSMNSDFKLIIWTFFLKILRKKSWICDWSKNSEKKLEHKFFTSGPLSFLVVPASVRDFLHFQKLLKMQEMQHEAVGGANISENKRIVFSYRPGMEINKNIGLSKSNFGVSVFQKQSVVPTWFWAIMSIAKNSCDQLRRPPCSQRAAQTFPVESLSLIWKWFLYFHSMFQ